MSERLVEERLAGLSAGDEDYPPLAPLEPIVFNRPALLSTDRPRFKAVAFNVFGGGRFDEIVRLLRTPPAAGAGVILLNEIDWNLGRSGKRELAAELAARLAMSFAFEPELGFARDAGTAPELFHGNAILSAWPLQAVRPIGIPASYRLSIGKFKRAPRSYTRRIFAPACIAAEIVLAGRRITICAVHLESHTDPCGRDRQIKAHLELLPQSGPVLMGGDFNTTTTKLSYQSAVTSVLPRLLRAPRRFREPQRYEPLFERMRAAGFATEGANVPLAPTFTFSRIIPRLMRPKLDWFAYRELRPVPGSARVMPARTSLFASRVSDHDLIVCEFEL